MHGIASLVALAGALQRLDVSGFIYLTVIGATPLVLAALGGTMSERSGVTNIALEGIMLTGAFVGYVAGLLTHSLALGVLAAVVSGILISALHAVLSIRFLVDQIVSGTVINILALGITGLFYGSVLSHSQVKGPGTLGQLNIPVLSGIPFLGQILFQYQFITYAMLVLVVATHLLLFNTVWGLRTRACGEHPLAADTAGVAVDRIRYLNVLLGGALAGLGGAYFSLQDIGNFLPNMTQGRGFIALAAMIFGKWTPFGAFGASLLFAAAGTLAGRLQLAGVHIPVSLLSMIPYVLTIVVVAGAMGRAIAPAAVGKPYKKA
jgi:general nucleoside transport system permease protein